MKTWVSGILLTISMRARPPCKAPVDIEKGWPDTEMRAHSNGLLSLLAVGMPVLLTRMVQRSAGGHNAH